MLHRLQRWAGHWRRPCSQQHALVKHLPACTQHCTCQHSLLSATVPNRACMLLTQLFGALSACRLHTDSSCAAVDTSGITWSRPAGQRPQQQPPVEMAAMGASPLPANVLGSESSWQSLADTAAERPLGHWPAPPIGSAPSELKSDVPPEQLADSTAATARRRRGTWNLAHLQAQRMAAVPEHVSMAAGLPAICSQGAIQQPVPGRLPEHMQGGYKEERTWGQLASLQRSFSADVPPSIFRQPQPGHAFHRQSLSDGAFYNAVQRPQQQGVPEPHPHAWAGAGPTLPALHGAHHAWQQAHAHQQSDMQPQLAVHTQQGMPRWQQTPSVGSPLGNFAATAYTQNGLGVQAASTSAAPWHHHQLASVQRGNMLPPLAGARHPY
jgi:hypothetical protein